MAVLPYPLDPFGHKVFSQNDEDGIISTIVSGIKMTKVFAEIGAHSHEANCLYLYRNGWRGVFIDANGDDKLIKKHYVTAKNIDAVIGLYIHRLADIGILSIDVDGQDIYLWQATQIDPPLVIIEYNNHLPEGVSWAIPEDDNYHWDGTKWFGASLEALKKVASKKGYTLVYTNGTNAFFVRTDLFDNFEDFSQVSSPLPSWQPADDPLVREFVEIN